MGSCHMTSDPSTTLVMWALLTLLLGSCLAERTSYPQQTYSDFNEFSSYPQQTYPDFNHTRYKRQAEARECNPSTCRLPNCYCGGKAIPGGLSPKEIPQFV